MREIRLTQGKVALVDDEDYEEVMKHRWHAHKNRTVWYAEASLQDAETGQWSDVSMHVFLLGSTNAGMTLDHIDGDGLNNQRRNLRWASRSQQRANSPKPRTNTSGFKGVYFDQRRARWCARLKANGRMHYLGSYVAPEDAARAYDSKAREVFGPFARPNFSTLGGA